MMELDELILKLKLINFQKDSIYLVEQTIKKISLVEPKDSIFINKLLDTIESQDGEIFSRMILTCALRNLSMTSSQIERIWKMFNDTKRYNSTFRGYLLKSLNGLSLDEHEDIINELYKRFKNGILIEEKIQIAEVLLNVNTVSGEIASWLFDFTVNDNLPSEIDDINTIALQTDCCDVLSSHKNYMKKATKAIFHLIIQCKFLKYDDARQWEIIKDTFLKMPLDEVDVHLILELIKDYRLISYHRIAIMSLLIEITSTVDIVMALIDILVMEGEPFEDFNTNVVDVILKLKIMPKHLKYIERLQKSDIVLRQAKKELKTILISFKHI